MLHNQLMFYYTDIRRIINVTKYIKISYLETKISNKNVSVVIGAD